MIRENADFNLAAAALLVVESGLAGFTMTLSSAVVGGKMFQKNRVYFGGGKVFLSQIVADVEVTLYPLLGNTYRKKLGLFILHPTQLFVDEK